MTKQEFLKEVTRLISAYGESQWPPERIEMLWGRAKNADAFPLSRAVNGIIFRMPPPRDVAGFLEEALAPSASDSLAGQARMDREHPVQPNAAALAAAYSPGIKATIGRGLGRELPYDKNERIIDAEFTVKDSK